MRGEFNFSNLQQLVDAINALKTVGVTIDYRYTPGVHIDFDMFDMLLWEKNDFVNVEYVLKDMENNNDRNRNFYSLIDYLLQEDQIGTILDDPEEPPKISILIQKINTTVAKMVLEYTFKNAEQTDNYDFIGLFEGKLNTIPLYMKTRNEDLLNFILENLNVFDKKQFTKKFMDIVVKNIDRDTYLDMTAMIILPNMSDDTKAWRLKHNAFITKKYDDAVKRRVTDISAGFGYQGIPNLQLQAIIGEAVDTSGMTAYKVDKIIDKFNIWKTDTTMRAGAQEQNQAQFKDAYAQDDDDDDDDVIEI